MTAEEIRAQVSPMVIWMADAAIRQARKAITTKSILCCYDWENVHHTNKPEVETASEVLFHLFSACTADVKKALVSMPAEYDGYNSGPGRNYFNAFVDALASASYRSVRLREPDWVLERL